MAYWAMGYYPDENVLQVGHAVLWRGSWGSESEQIAKVTSIQVNDSDGSKFGETVQSVAWDSVIRRQVIVNLNVESPHGGGLTHWAWANQIRRIPPVDQLGLPFPLP